MSALARDGSLYGQRERAYDAIEMAARELEFAKAVYVSALLAGAELGCNKSEMARRAGKSEAAVRLMIKRHRDIGEDEE